MSRQTLYDILGIGPGKHFSEKVFTEVSGIDLKKLRYYNSESVFPLGGDLEKISVTSGISPLKLKISMGLIDLQTTNLLSEFASEIESLLSSKIDLNYASEKFETSPNFHTPLGKLYSIDCLTFLNSTDDDTYDLIFADPPFNLNKEYPSNINDRVKDSDYLSWCEEWVKECSRVLKPGGTLYLWNIPKWNIRISEYARKYLSFRNLIGVDIKYSLPIKGRLYPSHYSLLSFTKGKKPNTFNPDRLPMQTCPKCYHEIKDYGGYKSKMNPLGINLSDIWIDIPPVRHKKYKRRENSNELSIKLLDRIIEMSSNEGDLIFDPFGGSGTTYVVAELKNRRWHGTEIGPLEEIVNRFDKLDDELDILKKFREGTNRLFTEKVDFERQKRGLWRPEDFTSTVNLELDL